MPAHTASRYAIDAHVPACTSDDSAQSGARAGHVLVVDDDIAVRHLLERHLAAEGYTTKSAADAIAAVDSMAQEPAAMVLCDIRMPGHDGLWLTERLHAEWPSTPVVMVTALDDLGTIQLSRDVGAVDYLTKPVSQHQLNDVMQRVFPRSKPTPPSPDDASTSAPLDQTVEAEYTLETPVRCPACGERTGTLKAVRLVRARVNFTSTLPRRGRVLACPYCLAMVPAELTNF